MALLIAPTNLGRPVRLLAFVLIVAVLGLLTWGRYDPRIGFGGFTRVRADILGFIDPLIGTLNGGHVFPGATLPYGMAKAGPDTDNRGENAAGWVSDDSAITGFSHLHDSGTGGAPSLGNFPLFAHPWCPNDDPKRCTFTTLERKTLRAPSSVEARVGFFALNLTTGVRAEMTASAQATLFRFTFPEGAKPLILLDVEDIASSRSDGGIKVDRSSGRMTGHGTFAPSFGTGTYKAFFCADFAGSHVRAAGVFAGSEATPGLHEWDALPWGSAGAWLHFDETGPDGIFARVGVSFISSAQACHNAEEEIPEVDLDTVEAEARAVWADKLSSVSVDAVGVSTELQTVFWSGLYRSMLSPQNYTGENPLWQSSEPYFDSFYCIWDSFPRAAPAADHSRSRQAAGLPHVLLQGDQARAGSNADVVVVDALLKGITDGIDWETAYEAIVSDAEISPPSFNVGGRGNIESWQQLHYIASDHRDANSTGPHSRTVSRTVEYAFNDFCIATMARWRGHTGDFAKYAQRSTYWQNLWNPAQIDLPPAPPPDLSGTSPSQDPTAASKFVGFLQPRLANGTFLYQSPRVCSPTSEPHLCYYDTKESTYEGSPWLYTFYAPHDMATLAGLMGGARRSLRRRLDSPTRRGPGLSAKWARAYVPAHLNGTMAGIPGNDDGAMGAFAAFVMMGFFPVAGMDVYLLTAPFFREVRLRARKPGREAVIRKVAARGEDPMAEGMLYVQSVKLNGRKWTKSWITHDFFAEGGLLEVKVGKEESAWGTNEEDLPPSWGFEEFKGGEGQAQNAEPSHSVGEHMG
ncbi:conserved hypothetical protein [Verticillium alfalfae VaMs.102]|uniref:Glycosyl hydrolase n=1 Tax=Verticillium alfalfae (strain VaMs.102 / ATCC MYA-4576 / FGSC 10136) TaxID=526221 RepID=C9ST94_VERA1|nr:conserved hypothetical protein [Verticillium alfalfae VaMs.102]EEY22009.1 conserved hypothetical protein [Verticillium alfalfae VaMs.102]